MLIAGQNGKFFRRIKRTIYQSGPTRGTDFSQ